MVAYYGCMHRCAVQSLHKTIYLVHGAMSRALDL